jgi:hypothetical protein
MSNKAKMLSKDIDWDKVYKMVIRILKDYADYDASWVSEDIMIKWRKLESYYNMNEDYLKIDLNDDDNINSVIKKSLEFADKILRKNWSYFGFSPKDVDEVQRKFNIPDKEWKKFKKEKLRDYFYKYYVPTFLRRLKKEIKWNYENKLFMYPD